MNRLTDPEEIVFFENSQKGNSALIIGGGPSTEQIISCKNLHDYFDVIIVVNSANKFFEKQADYHMVLEQAPRAIIDKMQTGTPDPILPRFIDPVTTLLWPENLNLIPTERKPWHDDPFRWTGGFMSCYGGGRKVVSSIALQALHWACILGCNRIYTIGLEMRWRKDFNSHFYGDVATRVEPNKLHFEKTGFCYTEFLDEGWETIDIFLYTAEYINALIKDIKPYGVQVFDFSKGLITEANQVELKDVIND